MNGSKDSYDKDSTIERLRLFYSQGNSVNPRELALFQGFAHKDTEELMKIDELMEESPELDILQLGNDPITISTTESDLFSRILSELQDNGWKNAGFLIQFRAHKRKCQCRRAAFQVSLLG